MGWCWCLCLCWGWGCEWGGGDWIVLGSAKWCCGGFGQPSSVEPSLSSGVLRLARPSEDVLVGLESGTGNGGWVGMGWDGLYGVGLPCCGGSGRSFVAIGPYSTVVLGSIGAALSHLLPRRHRSFVVAVGRPWSVSHPTRSGGSSGMLVRL